MKTTIFIFALICLGGVFARTAGNACLAGQVKVENAFCVACATANPGCVECSDAGTCTKCAAGFNLNGKACVANDKTCAEPLCDISGTQGCATCAAGYRFALKDTAATAYCVACTQGNCAQCTVDECTACNAGFFVQDKACVACGANCAACTGADACTTCAAGFFGTGTCTACSAGCVECSAADVCTRCGSNFVLATATNACVAFDGCEEAADEKGEKCKTCRDGFRLLADGKCTACTANAQTCEGTGTDQTILTCLPPNILTTATATLKASCAGRTDGQCVKQDAAGVCSKCASGYFVSKGKCVTAASIDANCADANDGNETDTAATCKTCNGKSYPSTTTPITCTACNADCNGCTATGCTACAAGYYKATATATSCTPCDAGGADQCTEKNASTCKAGYGLQDHGICKACDPSYNCSTCSAYQTCATCAAGHSVSAEAKTLGQCVKCGEHCTTKACTTGPDTCSGADGCVSPYVINSVTKKCENKCAVAKCTTCNATDYSKCGTCNEGYYADAAGVCQACASGCGACTGAAAADCTRCTGGKALHATNKTCLEACSSTTGTVSCTNADGLTATTTFSARVCSPGYVATADFAACLACSLTGCSVCTGPATPSAAVAACTTCSDGYYLDGSNLCQPCTPAAAAATCSAVDVHSSCKTGYGLGTVSSKATCLQINTGCVATAAGAAIPTSGTASTDLTTADTCGTGLFCGAGYLKNASNKCEACTTPNCATCSTTPVCTGCKTNYKLTSTKTCILETTKPTGCTTPVAAEWDKCDTCSAGFFKTATNTCSPCSGGCTCTSATDCTGCANTNHYYASSATPQTCTACSVANCQTCSSTAADICDTCASGFFPEGTDKKKCTACASDCKTCTTATDCSECNAKYFLFTLPLVNNVAATSVKFCAMCASNCKTCTVKTDGSQTCDECNANYYLSADKKSCSNTDCSGTDGKTCNKCLYGKILKEGKCADCTGDNSCPASCTATTGGPATGGPGAGNNTTAATDSGSKIAFSLLVLAFFAILGHMMI